jgi:hypothetical protein
MHCNIKIFCNEVFWNALCGTIWVRPFPGQEIKLKGGDPLSLILTDTQHASLKANFVDAKGQPVTGVPIVWDASDATLVTPTQDSADPTVCDAAATGTGLGTSQVHATATNPDGTTAVLVIDVVVMPGDAVSGNIAAGPASEIVPPPPPPAPAP